MDQENITQSKEMAILAVAGGLAFWVANFVISLTPIAVQEMILAVRLIVKGFNPSAIASLSPKTATNELLSVA